MSANASDYLEGKMLDFMLRNQSFTPSGTLAIALTSDIPTDASTGAVMTEIPNAGSYARQAIVSSTTAWSHDSSTGNTAYNNAAITFPQATSDWSNISGCSIVDTSIYGAGNVYFWGQLTSPQSILNTQQLVIPISGISIQWL